MADIQKHFIFLKEEYSDLKNLEILEIACGSGSSADTLPPENSYTGIDISPGLLRIADKRFRKKGLKKTSFFISDAKDLPFEEEFFDVSICNLSLNFFIDNGKAINEIKRVLKQGGGHFTAVFLFLNRNLKKAGSPVQHILQLSLKSCLPLPVLRSFRQSSKTEQYFIFGR